MATTWINDRSLADFGFALVGDPKGWVGPPNHRPHLLPMLGRMGSLRIPGESESATRTVTLEAAIRHTSQSAFEAAWDQFTGWVATEQELELRFSQPWPNRIGFAHYESASPSELTGMYKARKVDLTFVMPDPLRYDRYPDVYTLTNGEEVAIQLGSGPTDVRLQFIGTGFSNPRVLYKDAQGQVRGDLSFAVTLAGATWIDWNGDLNSPRNPHLADGYELPTLYTYTAPTTITPLDVPEMQLTRAFVLDGLDGDAAAGPTLTAINCSLTAFVRRSWR